MHGVNCTLKFIDLVSKLIEYIDLRSGRILHLLVLIEATLLHELPFHSVVIARICVFVIFVTPAATAGSLQDKHVTALHGNRALSTQVENLARFVTSLQQVDPSVTTLAARETVWAEDAALGEDTQ